MSTNHRYFTISAASKILLLIAAAFLTCIGPGAAPAADQLGYSFETGLDGFAANGGGTTVTQDTIGATQGTHSMKVDVVAGATFVGALTQTLDTTTIGNTAIVGYPPGLDHVTFDLTVTKRFGQAISQTATDPFNGFVSVGVTIFGTNQAGQERNAQVDYSIDKEFKAGSLEAGTYHDCRIDLDALINPDTFTDNTFNELYGPQGSNPPAYIPTGFELYINKSGNSSDYDHSLTLYFDNVRFGTGPAGVLGDYNGNGTVDMGDYVQWRNGGPLQNEIADLGTISTADYTAWKSAFGNHAGSGSALGSAVVPEPATTVLLLSAIGLLFAGRRCCN